MIPKLSIAPQLSDKILCDLSIKDHVKYLFFYNSFRHQLSQSENYSDIEIARLCANLDWFRQINHLVFSYNKSLALDYIRFTFPYSHWDSDFDGTVKAFEFAFCRQLGLPVETLLSTSISLENKLTRCSYCFSPISSSQAILRRLAVSCIGCRVERLSRPIRIKTFEQFPNDFADSMISLRGNCFVRCENHESPDLILFFCLKLISGYLNQLLIRYTLQNTPTILLRRIL